MNQDNRDKQLKNVEKAEIIVQTPEGTRVMTEAAWLAEQLQDNHKEHIGVEIYKSVTLNETHPEGNRETRRAKRHARTDRHESAETHAVQDGEHRRD